MRPWLQRREGNQAEASYACLERRRSSQARVPRPAGPASKTEALVGHSTSIDCLAPFAGSFSGSCRTASEVMLGSSSFVESVCLDLRPPQPV